jgi:hypothetical protein
MSNGSHLILTATGAVDVSNVAEKDQTIVDLTALVALERKNINVLEVSLFPA